MECNQNFKKIFPEVFRARIILGLAQGLSHEEIAKEQSVRNDGPPGLGLAPRRSWTGT
jgi:hypothetical protein